MFLCLGSVGFFCFVFLLAALLVSVLEAASALLVWPSGPFFRVFGIQRVNFQKVSLRICSLFGFSLMLCTQLCVCLDQLRNGGYLLLVSKMWPRLSLYCLNLKLESLNLIFFLKFLAFGMSLGKLQNFCSDNPYSERHHLLGLTSYFSHFIFPPPLLVCDKQALQFVKESVWHQQFYSFNVASAVSGQESLPQRLFLFSFFSFSLDGPASATNNKGSAFVSMGH